MREQNQAVVPHGSRRSSCFSGGHSGSAGVARGILRHPPGAHRYLPVAFVLLALIACSPASSLGSPGDPAPGHTWDRGSPAPAAPGNATGFPAWALPSIAANETPGSFTRNFSFRFQATNITLSTAVDASLYYGARDGDKFAMVPEGTSPEAAAPAYYRAFVEDPRQDGMFSGLLGSLRAIRLEGGYDDDEYLELMAVFVQSVPYDNTSGNRPGTPARFPAETLADGRGDCDDKSLLLAGLLAREGYDTALLLFIPEHHMAVGVKGNGPGYRNTSYQYIETTGVTLVGVMPSDLSQSLKYVPPGESPSAVSLSSEPLVIRVGSGTRTYTASGETAFIVAQRKAVDARISRLRHELDAFSGDDPLRYRRLMEDYAVYTGIHNRLVKNPHDRPGEYRYLRNLAPEFLCSPPPGNPVPGEPAFPPVSLTGTAGACLPLTLHGAGPCSPGDRDSLSCG